MLGVFMNWLGKSGGGGETEGGLRVLKEAGKAPLDELRSRGWVICARASV